MQHQVPENKDFCDEDHVIQARERDRDRERENGIIYR